MKTCDLTSGPRIFTELGRVFNDVQCRSRWANQVLSRDSPLNELARNKPSDVTSRNSTSAKNFGSTHVGFGFLIVLVDSVELLPDLAGVSARPTSADLAHVHEVSAFSLPEIEQLVCARSGGVCGDLRHARGSRRRNRPVDPADRLLVLQFRKVRAALVDYNHFAIDDCLTRDI